MTAARQRHAVWALVILLPAVGFIALRLNPSIDPRTIAPEQHFYIVSAAALLGLALALAAARVALRTDSPRIYLVSLGLLLMAGTFAVHGLATPGFLVDARYFSVVGFSARIAIWLGALFLALSLLPIPSSMALAMARVRVPLFISVGLMLGAYAAAGLAFPESVPPRIMSARLFLDGTLVTAIGFGLASAVGYALLYRRTGAAAYGAVAVGSVLIVEAQLAMHFGTLWNWSWWLYHLHLLGAFLTMFSFPFAARAVEAANDIDAEDDVPLAA